MSPRESFWWLRTLWEHRRNLSLSREKLEAMQLRKFRRLAAFARERSPFYRRIMQERGIDPRTAVPADFPVLTKNEVIRHFDQIVTDRRITRERIADFLAASTDPGELFDGRYHVLHTSGTSGTVGYFVFSHEAWIKGACQVVRAVPLGWRRRTAFVAATRGHFAGASLMLTGNHSTNSLFYNVRNYDVGLPMPHIIDELNAFQPQALSGYATILKILAEAKERGELRIAPSHVGNGGEPLMAETKEFVERVFQTRVMNAYACSEHLYMGLTFPGSEGMDLLEDDLMFELHEDHTCVTNLFNDTMPLIRYRMDDVLAPEPAASGPRPFTRVREVVGRIDHALVFTNEHGREDFIHPIVIVELIIKGLSAWQVVLTSKTSFRFRARLAPGLSAQERQTALALIRRKMDELLAEKRMGNVSYEIEETEHLPLDPHSGKFRLVVQEYRNEDEKPEPAESQPLHGLVAV